MRRPKGTVLAAIGLLLGVFAGIGLVLLKQYLIGELVEVLDEEVKKSCACSIEYDSFHLSLVRLRAEAKNVRIVEHGKPMLSFKRISGKVSLRQIEDRLIHIDNLVLSDGYADGVGPDSVTFRFIDTLTTPPPPELQRPDRWKAVLNRLEVTNSALREPFGGSELVGKGVSLIVTRDGENFHLSPRVADLRYRIFPDSQSGVTEELPLGPLSSELTIEDARVVFKSLSTGRDASNLEMTAIVDTEHDDVMSGSSRFTIDTQYIGLPAWMRGTLSGEAGISGTLGNPVFEGPATSGSPTPFVLEFDNAPPIALTSLNGLVSVDINRGDPVVTLSKLVGEGLGARLEGSNPLVFRDGRVTAGFSARMDSFSYGPFSMRDLRGSIEILQRPEGTVTEFLIDGSSFEVQGVSIGPARLLVRLRPHFVDINIQTTEPRLGSLRGEGRIALSTQPGPSLQEGKLILDKYRYPLKLPVSVDVLAPAALDGSYTIAGPLDLAALQGAGSTVVSFPAIQGGLPMDGATKLEGGKLKVSSGNASTGITSTLEIDLAGPEGGKLGIQFPKVPLTAFAPAVECGHVSGKMDYRFPLRELLRGTGTVLLESAELGCAPYQLRIPRNASLPIKNGAVQFSSLTISGVNSNLDVSGSLGIERGYDLTFGGNLFLNAFLPFVGSLDDLRGVLTTRLKLTGPLTSPSFSGSADLKEGEVGWSTPELEAHEVTGSFSFGGSTITVNSLAGILNEGKFTVRGSIDPLNPARSKLDARLERITIEPLPESVIVFSGDARFATGMTGKPTLSGNITVDFAEVVRDLNPNRLLVNALAGYVMSRKSTPAGGGPSEPVNLDLDIQVNAPRNMFVVTPLFNAELGASLRAAGSASNPSLRGGMQVLGGWIDLKGNRFEITNGSVTFKPESTEPFIEITSEGMLRTPTGENILVLLETTGPLSAPRLNLSSDRGLSHDELLLLLTSSRSLTGRTLANTAGGLRLAQDRSLLSRDTFSSIGAFFRNLTQIDTLSFEPIYNPFTGLIEPGIVGRKKLTDRLALVGASTFGTISTSRAGLVYDLSRSLKVSTFLESVSSRQRTALSSDLTYTILASQARVVDIEVEGLKDLDEASILDASRIGPSSRIKNKQESLATVAKDVTNYLIGEGYLAAKVDVTCVQGDRYCRRLHITVQEGPRHIISGFRIINDPLPEPVLPVVPKIIEEGEPALSSTLSDLERDVIIGLRKEGYVATRVSTSYEPAGEANKVYAIISVDLRQPISFVFEGNKLFSPSEFLDSIQLFERKRPFGNNTINVLVQNIERMYQERGYLFVRVGYDEDKTDPGRLTYIVRIEEDLPVRVRSLQVDTVPSVSLERIKAVMTELGYAELIPQLGPKYAVPDLLESLRETLTLVHQHEGYPNATVQYEIIPDAKGTSVDIRFTVDAGQPVLASSLEVVGLPQEVASPTPPTAPVSLPRANRFIEQLLNLLRDEGFLRAGISTDFEPDTQALILEVESGPRTVISNLSYEGLVKIEEKVIKKYSTLLRGMPYRAAEVNQTKRSLLSSGLFSRVEVAPVDGELDSPGENVVIRVTERPLKTLEVGGGANSEFGVHVFGEAVDREFFADGQSIALRLDSYFDEVNASDSSAGKSAISQGFASLRYLNPRFLDSDLTFTEELRFQRQDLATQEFDQDRLSTSTYWFKQFSSGASLFAGHTLLWDTLENVSPDAVISDLDTGAVRLSFLSATANLDRRDDPLLPNRGYTFTFEPRLASRTLGSEADFASLTARATTIIPFNPMASGFSLGLGLRGGIAQPFGSTEEIPITQRFYLGGRTSVRGFRENSLGPRGAQGSVIGGDTLVMGTTQLQYLIGNNVSTHAFLDAGTVYLRERSFSASDLRYSTGLGFQYLSPIGPIGLDVGRPLNERSGEPSFRLHFSVGSTF